MTGLVTTPDLLTGVAQRRPGYTYALKNGRLALDHVLTASQIITDPGKMTATGVFVSSSIDRVGDRISMAGINTDNHQRNPVVLWNHGQNPNFDMPIGKTEDENGRYLVQIGEHEGVATTVFSQTLPCAAQFFGLIAEKILRAQSIGFDKIRTQPLRVNGQYLGDDLLEIEMVEVSWTGIGCNPDALLMAIHKNWDGRPLDPVIRAALEPYAANLKAWSPGATLPAPEPRKFSSTQFDLADGGYTRTQGNPSGHILEMAMSIPDADLAADGREDRPHVTVKYGLHTSEADKVRHAVAGFGPVPITLGKTSLFPANEKQSQRGGDQFDVVKIDVESDRLRELNKLIADSLECTDTHPSYNPHVTLAYVKPGLGEKYAGRTDVEGQTLLLDRLIFSSKDRIETVILLVPTTQRKRYTFAAEDCPKCGASMEGDSYTGTCNSCGHKWGKFTDEPDAAEARDMPDSEQARLDAMADIIGGLMSHPGAKSWMAAARKAWDDSKHPRGQPGNAGQFGPGGGGGSSKPKPSKPTSSASPGGMTKPKSPKKPAASPRVTPVPSAENTTVAAVNPPSPSPRAGGAAMSQQQAKESFLPKIQSSGRDFAKKVEIQARPAKTGEKIDTVTADGKETTNTAKEGDFVVTNPGGEQYILSDDKLRSRYQDLGSGRYKATGSVRALEYKGPATEFQASWGESMALKPGDMIVSPLGADGKPTGEIYRIAKKEFEDTYGPKNKAKVQTADRAGGKEAQAAARSAVEKILGGAITKESHGQLLQHLPKLTVPQLKEIATAHNLKCPAKLKGQVLAKLAHHFNSKIIAKGSADVAKVAATLAPFARVRLDANETRAAQIDYVTIQQQYGTLAGHRIKELAVSALREMANLPAGSTNRDEFKKKLAGYAWMAGQAQRDGVTGQVEPKDGSDFAKAIDRITLGERLREKNGNGAPWTSFLLESIKNEFAIDSPGLTAEEAELPNAEQGRILADKRARQTEQLWADLKDPRGTRFKGERLDRALANLRADYGTMTQDQFFRVLPHLNKRQDKLTPDVIARASRAKSRGRKSGTFDESAHPRGQPGNAGQFGPGGVLKSLWYSSLTRKDVSGGHGNFDESKHPRSQNGQFGSGGGHAATPAKESGGSKLKAGLSKLAVLGKKGVAVGSHIEHAAIAGIKSRVAKLPPAVQKPVVGLWNAAMASYTAGLAAVKTVAAERGNTPEQITRVASICATFDIIGAKAGPIALGSAAVGFVPLGSVGYLAFATATNPMATWRAAKKAVAAVREKGVGTTAREVGHSMVTLKSRGASDKIRDAIISIMLDMIKAAPDPDEWMATFFAALDAVAGDVVKALKVTRAALPSATQS